MSIGMALEPKNPTRVSLTQLRKNARISRKEKKSGRKKPREGDYTVIPAPDAKPGTNSMPKRCLLSLCVLVSLYYNIASDEWTFMYHSIPETQYQYTGELIATLDQYSGGKRIYRSIPS